MFVYIVRRTVQTIPLLFIISIISFLLMTLAPGDPTAMFQNPEGVNSAESLDNIRESLGLNDPIYIQYLKWLKLIVLEGNMGYSFQDGRPVLTKIVERIPATLILMGTAITMSFLIAIPIGVFSAVRKYSTADNIFTFLSFLGVSIPSFFLALMAILVFSVKLSIFPVSGMRGDDTAGFDIADIAYHLVLPATVLAFGLIASLSRFMRSSMLEVINQDFIRTARAKGLSERKVVLKHALRNAMLPIITLIGLQLPNLLGGALIIEQIFAWPGMGRLGIGSIFIRDYQVIMGITMVGSVLVVIGNLLADVLYAIVDPRIQYGKN
ncbi:ABC transporter permease [Paenibacillus thermotolerans]|uniref:ABC transporter permease n=1 Tax=Paenibacillus thermotolerans TaxID=3027807 RepID=UPI0023679C77|nr:MULTISPECIES: ABC transporter permease [unclassified Paenibacillus]